MIFLMLNLNGISGYSCVPEFALKVQQETNSARLYVGDTSVGSSIIHRSSIYFIYLVHFGVSSQKTSNQTLVTRTSRCKECTVENKYDTGISFLRKYFFFFLADYFSLPFHIYVCEIL